MYFRKFDQATWRKWQNDPDFWFFIQIWNCWNKSYSISYWKNVLQFDYWHDSVRDWLIFYCRLFILRKQLNKWKEFKILRFIPNSTVIIFSFPYVFFLNLKSVGYLSNAVTKHLFQTETQGHCFIQQGSVKWWSSTIFTKFNLSFYIYLSRMS